MQIINLQIVPNGVKPVVHASQFDKGREIKFKLFDGSLAYTIPSGAKVKVEGVKSNKDAFSYLCEHTGNTVTLVTKEQMTVLAETVPCELRIYNDDAQDADNQINIGTLNFNLVVEKSPIDGNVNISNTEIPAIISAARNQQKFTTDAEAWAIGKREGKNVTSTDEAYNNNSKYYSNIAKNYSTNAKTQFDNAKAQATLAQQSATLAQQYAEQAENAANNSGNGGSGGGGDSPAVVVDSDAILYDISDASLSSKEFVNKIGIGINIGNFAENYAKSYLEQPSFTEPSDWLTAIGSTLIDDSYFKFIKSLGFGLVRIPITWLNHWNKSLNTVSGEWLDAIENLVKMAIRNGLYVIINAHHDGGQHSGHRIDDKDTRIYYSNLWRQISNRFCKYGTHLIYELSNEITDSSKSMTANEERIDRTFLFNDYLLDALYNERKTNSNEYNRFIIVAGYAGLTFQDVETVNGNYSLQDSNYGLSDKLISTTHIYTNSPSSITRTVNNYLSSHSNGVICTEVGYEGKPIDSTFVDAMFNTYQHPSNGGTVCIWDNNGFSYGMISRTDNTVFNHCFNGQVSRLEQEWNLSEEEVLKNLNGKYPSSFEQFRFKLSNYYYREFTIPSENNNNTFYGKKIIKALLATEKMVTKFVLSKKANYAYYVEGVSGGRVIYFVALDSENPEWIKVFDKNATDFAVQQYDEKIYLYGTTEDTYVSNGNYSSTSDDAPKQKNHCTNVEIQNTAPIALSGETLTAQLDVTLTPSNTTDAVTYASADSLIATVSNDGLITARKTGTTTITVTCGSVSDTITVNVTMPTQQEDTYSHILSYDASSGELPNTDVFTMSNHDENPNVVTPTMGTGVGGANCLKFQGANTIGFVKPKNMPSTVSKAEMVAHISISQLSSYDSYISPFLCRYWNGQYGAVGSDSPTIKKIYVAGVRNQDIKLNDSITVSNNNEIVTTNTIYEFKMVADFVNDICQLFIDGQQIYGDFPFATKPSNTERGYVLGIQNEHCTMAMQCYDFTLKWNE